MWVIIRVGGAMGGRYSEWKLSWVGVLLCAESPGWELHQVGDHPGGGSSGWGLPWVGDHLGAGCPGWGLPWVEDHIRGMRWVVALWHPLTHTHQEEGGLPRRRIHAGHLGVWLVDAGDQV